MKDNPSPKPNDLETLSGKSSTWLTRAKTLRDKGGSLDDIRFCLQKAYFDSDDLSESFYNFCRDVIGNTLLEHTQHIKFARLLTSDHRFKMLQAARGTMKSSIGAAAYSAWRIGQEVFKVGESRLRILLTSEVLALAERNIRWAKQMMEWKPVYTELAGDQRPKGKSQPWGIQGLMSGYRREARIAELTVAPMGMDAERTGFHYDIIICDDLEAERSSATHDQIDRCYDFYRLLHSIMDPNGELIILCTRWHDDDIYARIEAENKHTPKDERFKIVKCPAAESIHMNKIYFPKILPKKKLLDLNRKQGSFIFHSQYLLEAHSEDMRQMKGEWLKYVTIQHLKQAKLHVYTTGDIAWTDYDPNQIDTRKRRANYSVVSSWAVDEQWNYILLDKFRERCTLSTTIGEIFRQWERHESLMVILQKYDRAQIYEAIQHYAFDYGKLPHIQWVIYPAQRGKLARHESIVLPLFEAGRIFLHHDMQWFIDEEYLNWPKSKQFDFMDNICNVAYYAKPTAKTKIIHQLTKRQREIKALKGGSWQDQYGLSDEGWRLF